MKTTIVYVLISNGRDDFCEMTLLSLHSLRLYHPNDDVVIITDTSTDRLFTDRYGHSPENARIITVPVPEDYDNKKRSRYLKTTLREHLSGDFLYIDCDTLICAPLTDLDSLDMDLGCVHDGHVHDTRYRDATVLQFERLGGHLIPGTPYYNSGVIYVKDSDISHRLFKEWFRLWSEYVTEENVVDQPALYQANINLAFPVHELPDEWNCMIQYGGKPYLHTARIMHYFSMDNCATLLRDVLFASIRKSGFCDNVIDRICRNPKTIGYAVFSKDLGRREFAEAFLFSDILPVYLDIQPLYRFFLFCSKNLYRPLLRIIRFLYKSPKRS